MRTSNVTPIFWCHFLTQLHCPSRGCGCFPGLWYSPGLRPGVFLSTSSLPYHSIIHVRATVSPQRSLLSKGETHDGILNGIFLNEQCKPTQDPSGRYRPLSYHTSCSNLAWDIWQTLPTVAGALSWTGPLSLVNRRRGQLGNRQLMPGLAERFLTNYDDL